MKDLEKILSTVRFNDLKSNEKTLVPLYVRDKNYQKNIGVSEEVFPRLEMLVNDRDSSSEPIQVVLYSPVFGDVNMILEQIFDHFVYLEGQRFRVNRTLGLELVPPVYQKVKDYWRVEFSFKPFSG